MLCRSSIRAALLCAAVLLPVCAQAQRVHEPAFQVAIDRWIDGRVKGYAFVIANRDGIVAEAAGGWAQAPGDGNLRMSTTIPAGFGSNQKVLSGNALLDLLEERSAPVAQELNTPIRFFVPDRWIEAYFNAPFHETLKLITLRDLLDHTSALPQERDGGSHGTRIARALAEGASAIDFANNKREYNNHNYTLLLYIIPNLAYPEEVSAIERNAAGLSLRDYNVRVANEYGKLYTRYMNEKFLPRTLSPVRGTCRPGDLAGNRYAKEYATRSSNDGRTDNAAGFCRSQGSWFYSARDMAHIWRTIEFSNRIVKPSTRKLYRANVAGPRPIYWRSFSHGFLGAESKVDIYRGHGGVTRFDSNSVTIRLPWGYVGVGVVNSGELDPTTLGKILLNAFYEATRATFEYDTDRPGSDLRSFILGNPDPALCARACEDNDRCQAWTYVMPRIQHPLGAKCWLKDGTPAPVSAAKRISGIKGARYGTDRPGNNLRSVEVGRDDPALCRFLCAADANCKAWTHVHAGLQADRAVCWLKRSAPQPRDAACCVSGLSPS